VFLDWSFEVVFAGELLRISENRAQSQGGTDSSSISRNHPPSFRRCGCAAPGSQFLQAGPAKVSGRFFDKKP
jgi:hypothetical protein